MGAVGDCMAEGVIHTEVAAELRGQPSGPIDLMLLSQEDKQYMFVLSDVHTRTEVALHVAPRFFKVI